MSISSAISNAQQKVADAYTAISNKGGTLPATQDLANMPTAINSITSVNNTNLSVTPLTTAQSFTVSAPYTGYYTVSVSAVTSSIDSNIKASNIKSGISILGVSGSVVELNADSVTINPSTSSQTITPTSPFNGFDEITVNPVTSSIDANITAGNIKSGVSILGVSGTVTELNGSSRSVTLTSASGQTFNPETGKNAITSITVAPNNQARTLTATTSQQTFTVGSGYSGNGTITLNAVTSSIDANIQAGNIKKDVTILGVTGTFEGGGGGITNIYSNYLARTNGNIEQLAKGAYTLGYTDTEISTYEALSSAYLNSNTVKEVVLRALQTISAQRALSNSFEDTSGTSSILSKADLSGIITISGNNALYRTFNKLGNLIDVNIGNLKEVSGDQAMRETFARCSAIKNIEFKSLDTLTGSQALIGLFGYSSIEEIYFPALTSTSFGTNTNQFGNMLFLVQNATVHFASNLQSVIGSWSDVTSGFGGTNTTVLFDLPATT